MTLLSELAKEITSKNAGNFVLTCDVVFEDVTAFQRVKKSGVLSVESVAELYSVDQSEIMAVLLVEQSMAYKVVMRRAHASGDIGETDVFGAQQYAPLLSLDIP